MGSHAPWHGAAFGSDAGAGAGGEVELLDDDKSGINLTPGVTAAIGGINNIVGITVDGKKIGPMVCALALPVVVFAPICSLNMQGTGAGMRPIGLTVLGHLVATEFKDNKDAVSGARTAPTRRTDKETKALDQRADAGA